MNLKHIIMNKRILFTVVFAIVLTQTGCYGKRVVLNDDTTPLNRLRHNNNEAGGVGSE